MKKTVVLLALAILLSGCASVQTKSEGWVREGSSLEQLKQDYTECRGPLYVKDGMSYEEYERDYNFCNDAENARYFRGASLSTAPWSVLPFGMTPGTIVMNASHGLCDSCMATKGYGKNDKARAEGDIDSCMREKGYEWK